MGTALVSLKPADISSMCFLPTKKRSSSAGFSEEPDAHTQIYDTNGICDFALRELIKQKTLSTTDIAPLKDPKKQIAFKKDLIEGHVERRVQLFFQQAILCYKTPFIYEANGAEDQIGEGQTLKTKGLCYKTQAAHSSTFPCLYASLKKEDGTKDPKTTFVFLKHSSAYRQHNATVELPDYVNKTDTVLDGKTNEKKLRARSLTLLNRCAKGDLNPVKATRIFLKILKEGSAFLVKKLEETDSRKKVAKIYEAQAKEILANIRDSDEIFDRIMGVKLHQQDDQESLLREIVYRRRFALIQQAEFTQSQIAKKIFETQNQIFQTRAKAVREVDYRLRYALLKEFTGENLRSLEKLFCTSIAQLEVTLKTKQKLKGTYEDLTQAQKKKITSLAKDLRKLFRELQKEEWTFRSKLFKDLRQEFKRWKQTEFVDKFKEHSPNEPMSQPMVSRLEQPTRIDTKTEYSTPITQRRKYIDVAKAQKIAGTFGVDNGLFLPALFTSDG